MKAGKCPSGICGNGQRQAREGRSGGGAEKNPCRAGGKGRMVRNSEENRRVEENGFRLKEGEKGDQYGIHGVGSGQRQAREGEEQSRPAPHSVKAYGRFALRTPAAAGRIRNPRICCANGFLLIWPGPSDSRAFARMPAAHGFGTAAVRRLCEILQNLYKRKKMWYDTRDLYCRYCFGTEAAAAKGGMTAVSRMKESIRCSIS